MVSVSQINQVSPTSEEVYPRCELIDERAENYINHPTWGLLYSVCQLEDNVELFTSIYTKRLFFLVTTDATHFKLRAIGSQEARVVAEIRLCQLRNLGQFQEHDQLLAVCQQTFR